MVDEHTGPKLPLYILAFDIAVMVDWQPRRVARLFRQQGIAMKRGRHVVTTPEKLREALPEIWNALYDKLCDKESW